MKTTEKHAVAAYLSKALSTGDTDKLLAALDKVIKAEGVSATARAAGLGREAVYKAIAAGNKPQFETVVKLFNAIGVRLTAEAATNQSQ
jgi:probable addiction module antidote protein